MAFDKSTVEAPAGVSKMETVRGGDVREERTDDLTALNPLALNPANSGGTARPVPGLIFYLISGQMTGHLLA